MRDVYFTPEYGKLYEHLEHAELKIFSFRCPEGEIYYQYLKRPIDASLSSEPLYDAMTPYGYGGPLVVRCEEGAEAALVEKYREALDRHLAEEKVVCEFVRFHPTEKNAQFFSSLYELRNCRTAVYTDCTSPDPFAAEFHPDTARRVRAAIRKGMRTELFTAPSRSRMEELLTCYTANMQAIGASKYYYFSQEYFDTMWEKLQDRLILVLAWQEDTLVGADLGFADNGIYTRHLSGVTDLGRKLGAARVMAAAQVRWAAEHNFRMVFHGCGLTSREDDALLTFKKYFTKGCFYEYWQGTRINNPEIYDTLCKAAGKQDNGTFFPAYRM